MIRDSNTLSDIHGVILSAQMDLDSEDPEFPVSDQIEELVERIEDKIRTNKSTVRDNWFRIALDHAKSAKERDRSLTGMFSL